MKTSLTLNKDILHSIDQVAEAASYLWERGWAERNAGNISINLTEKIAVHVRELHHFPFKAVRLPFPVMAGACLFVTATGSRMRDVAKRPRENAGIIRIAENLDGYHLLWGPRSGFAPTSELNTHLLIHSSFVTARTPERAVVHTHPTDLVALTQVPEFQEEQRLNTLLWGMHSEATIVIPRGVGFVPYVLTGTMDLAEATIKSLASHNVILWEKHGCLAAATDPLEAFDLIDVANKAARIYLLCKGAGHTPEGLTEEQLLELRKAFFGEDV